MNTLVIVAAQINLIVGDIEGNTQRIIETAQQAVDAHQADLVVFPELAITSYPPEDLLFRPMLYKRVDQALKTLCQSVKNTAILVGYPAKIDGQCYNMACVIQDGSITAQYAKQALPNHAVFDEARYFFSGNKATVFQMKTVSIGIIICEDTWRSEPVRQAKAAGAELIVSINASPFALDKSHARRNMLAERCAEAGLPIVYVNLVGGQDELVFDGGSMVYDADGRLAQQASYYQEDLMKVVFDLENNREISTRQTSNKVEPLDEEKLYNVLVLGVRDYIRKNQFSGAIVGISGGIDSALTLAIACDAIGSNAVQAVMMPSKYTADMSMEDAKAQATALGCQYRVIAIDTIFDAFQNALHDAFINHLPDSTEENLQARCRGTMLMALSNKEGKLVLITGNKSEMAVGYATLYGDMAGGFAVLKDVYKTMVYRLSRYRNTLAPVIPERVLERPPTAELAAGQLDQDTLPPYSVLDDILERFIRHEQDAAAIASAGFDPAVVEKVIQMLSRNEHKRRQAPPGIRLTEKAFDKDWRYPITCGYFRAFLQHLK